MSAFARAILLDTHAAVWWVDGQLAKKTLQHLVAAGLADGVFVSPISAWEIGMLAKPRSNGQSLQFLPDPMTWFARLMQTAVVKPAQFSNDIAIAASFLPGDFHSDPAGRLLVATARALNMPLMTRDRKILDYSAKGHLATIAC